MKEGMEDDPNTQTVKEGKEECVIMQFVVGVKDGLKKGKMAKLRLSYHCHLNRIALSV
jgi:hypothetical protein